MVETDKLEEGPATNLLVYTSAQLAAANKVQREQYGWDFSNEREFMENLFCTRFNFLLVAYSLFVTAAAGAPKGRAARRGAPRRRVLVCLGLAHDPSRAREDENRSDDLLPTVRPRDSHGQQRGCGEGSSGAVSCQPPDRILGVRFLRGFITGSRRSQSVRLAMSWLTSQCSRRGRDISGARLIRHPR
jgi:hypothetical protein